jgi:16S rRNA (adenine1518-N6/adenine1519-N6)-dimethyltransferase
MPRRLGQHFLADRRVLERIAEAVSPAGDELVIEIGAGRGALTALLAERAGLVLAIEIDALLARHLRNRFAASSDAGSAGIRRVQVIEANVLTLPLAALPARYGFGRAKVAGNLPYYITSPILARLFAAREALDRIVVMVQLEVARRLVALPGSRDYGLLSVSTQFHTRPELLFRIPPGAFRPAPKVDSGVVRMTPRDRRLELGIGDTAAFLRFVAACFRQKRKTLLNNLKGRCQPAAVESALERIGVRASARAEALSTEQLAKLFELVPGLRSQVSGLRSQVASPK